MWARNQLLKEETRLFVRDARDFALVNGMVLRNVSIANDNCVVQIPATLFPSPFPQKLYQCCLDLQPDISRLMLSIANDTNFMDDTLSGVVQVDDFTRNLLKINKIIQKEGQSQPIMSCISRSDYMMDQYEEAGKTTLRMRQVEVNAIASGMSAHSFNTSSMHRFLMSKYRIEPPQGATFPVNQSVQLVAQGLIDAHDCYGKTDAYILVVVEEQSFNFADHILIELEIRRTRPDIRLLRRSFMGLPTALELGPNKELLLENTKEVALVYFRYGYDPSNYDQHNAWDTRLLIERSRAIKCPSINFHLSGAKKFQQVLNNSQKLEKFLDRGAATKMADVFCKFWSIESDTPEGEEGFKVGLSSSRNLVLKPQREGGGHNVYGKDVKPFLENLPHPEERSQYIIMEYIDSPQEINWLLKHDDDPTSDLTRLDSPDRLVSELGIYGSILADGSGVISNKSSGYLVRSKKFGVNEGGVASGYAGLSSLMLIDDYSDITDKSLLYDVIQSP